MFTFLIGGRHALLILCFASILFGCGRQGKHLFILSGQSNMEGLDPNISFIPTVENEFGQAEVIVVKYAMGGQPIRRWYKDWESPVAGGLTAQPDLYDSLMNKVKTAVGDEDIETVTFLWMQGERDAHERLGDVYEESLWGLYNQLSGDLDREDVNFVIGRLSDFGMNEPAFPDWVKIRDVQMKVADSNPRFAWIDTDDLNDGVNARGEQIRDDLHMSVQGYRLMGERFANKSIELIEKN